MTMTPFTASPMEVGKTNEILLENLESENLVGFNVWLKDEDNSQHNAGAYYASPFKDIDEDRLTITISNKNTVFVKRYEDQLLIRQGGGNKCTTCKVFAHGWSF